jgi:hypothetical protein
MAKWKPLTSASDGNRIYLNLDNAIQIMEGGQRVTWIGFPGGGDICQIPVTQTVEQVVKLAKG